MLAPLALSDAAVLAATQPDEVIEQGNITGAVGTIIATLFLMLLFRGMGKVIAKDKKWDNAVWVLLALFGITGMLATIPPFSGWRQGIVQAIEAGAENAGRGQTFVTIILVALTLFGTYMLFSSQRFSALLVFVPVTLWLFLYDTMFGISQGYLNNVGHPLFDTLWGIIKNIPNLTER